MKKIKILAYVVFLLSFTVPSVTHATYSYYRPITVTANTSLASGTQTDFPMLVNISSSTYLKTTANGGSVQNASGYDIILSSTNACASAMSFEREKYDSATGEFIAWVKVPTMQAGAEIYLCYGDSSISSDQASPTDVWDSYYKGVWHLNETSGQHQDSTSNNNDSTVVSATTQGSAVGKIAGADLNTTSGNTTFIPSSASLLPSTGGNTITTSAWIKLSGYNAGFHSIIRQSLSNSDDGMLIDTSHKVAGRYAGTTRATSVTALSTGQWYYVSYAEKQNTTSPLYINGVADWTGTTPVNQSLGTLNNTSICGESNAYVASTYLLNGICDEVRISIGIQRSASWILTEYNNQNDPSTFYTIGSESAPVITLSPTSISAQPINVSYSQTITATGGSAPYTWTLSSGTLPTGLTLDTSSTANTTTISGTPTADATYNFTVGVSGGGASGSQAYSFVVSPPTAPDAPTSPAATAGNTGATMFWTAPAFNGGSAITGYLVEYKLSADGSWSTFETTSSSATYSVVTGLTNSSVYNFRVSAVNAIGTSTPSSTVNATPSGSIAAAKCYAVTSGNWNNPRIWASSVAGSGGSCIAGGGTSISYRGATTFIAPGVPGVVDVGDYAVINKGVTVRIPSGTYIQTNKGTYRGVSDGITISGDSNSYGSLVVDNGGLLKVHGASSTNDNYMTIDQYGVFQIMPGGAFWVGSGVNGPNISVSGKFYSGCLDQTSYPTPFCTGNAGGWVTASTGASLNITAVSSLPADLAVGDLVELSPPQSPTTYTHPYTGIDGTTPPPTPPILPTTDDTGSSPMKTCGSVASCLIPESTPLCVVAISGSSVTLGWPRGGTTAQPYCTGAETAINITSAGSGRLWLNKPAFLWGDPNLFVWNNPVSSTIASGSAVQGHFDALRSGFVLSEDGAGPISNAAGTGPGRIGDSSLTLNLSTKTSSGAVGPSFTSCSHLSLQDVTSSGCYLNYDKASMINAGFGLQHYGNFSFTGPYAAAGGSAEVNTVATLIVPSGTPREHNEVVIGNSDIRYLMKGISSSFIQLSGLANTTNQQVAFSYNTVRMTNNLLGFGSRDRTRTFTPTNVFEGLANSWYASSASEYGTGQINFWANTSNFDLSQNYINDFHPWISCHLVSPSDDASMSTFSGGTITNNNMIGSAFFSGQNSSACNWTNNLIQDNRITGDGIRDGAGSGWPSYVFALGGLDNITEASPNYVKYNIIYGFLRGARMNRGTVWDHNVFMNLWHHGLVFASQESLNGGVSGQGLTISNNIFATYGITETLHLINLGYAESQLIDGAVIKNNTIMGPASCIMLGDSDGGTYTLLVGIQIYDNICAPAGSGTAMIRKNANTSHPQMAQMQLEYVGYNAIQGATTPFLGVGPNANTDNIPNPEYNRNVLVTNTNGNYNTDATRNVTGVAIQNPTYSTAKTGGALRFTRTSDSNMTMAWALDGENYGAEAQLNWGGSGTTYSVSSSYSESPADLTVRLNSVITVNGTPFAAIGNPTSTSCPITRWALMTSGAESGNAFAIVDCDSTSSITFAPHASNISANDTFVILNPEVRLYDADGVDYIDVGIDARSLPTSSKTDTGINLAMTDYCTGCGSDVIITGLPTTFTSGTTGSPIAPTTYIPAFGGSAQLAFTSDDYVPDGTAWTSASSLGSYLGAVAPDDSAPNPPTIGTATAGNAQASVTFTAPGWNGGSSITSYTVTSSPGSITASGASSPIIVPGLTNGTAYTFTVTATNGTGTSSASSASNSVTPITVASAPVIGTATAGNAEASVTFTESVSNGGSTITGYTVTSSPGSITATGSSSPITITGLTNNTAYTFTVKATNGAGQSSASSASNSVTPVSSTAPSAPTIGTATRGNTQATVSFTAPVSDGGSPITSYTVTSSPGGITATGTSSSITITGLTNDIPYTFTVTATNAVGTSISSSATSAVVPTAGNRGFSPSPQAISIPTALPTPTALLTNGVPSSKPRSYNLGTTTLSVSLRSKKINPTSELQRFLNDTYNIKLVTDGVFGLKTKLWVKKWQAEHGLKADGVVGPKTKAAMKKSIEV
jgi:hypothetical protein